MWVQGAGFICPSPHPVRNAQSHSISGGWVPRVLRGHTLQGVNRYD